MPTIPIRALGSKGIIKDVPPYNLPVGYWSGGMNVKFKNGEVIRSNVFRDLGDESGYSTISEIRSCLGFTTNSGSDVIYLVDEDMVTWEFTNNTMTKREATGHVSSISADPVTWVTMNNVIYVNRETHIPEYKLTSNVDFAVLGSGWDTSWRCKALRGFKNYIIAINVTKGATSYPNMVKWSALTTFGAIPADWDHTLETSHANELPISTLRGEALDGGGLGNTFIVYSADSVHALDYIGAPFIFGDRTLFTDGGILTTNCWVEVGGYHYVFGDRDIYRHNGITKESIVSSRNKKFIYNQINKEKTGVSFVSHVEADSEIHFHFNSNSSDVKWPGTEFCNMSAVYNYEEDTWSFNDVPNVNSMTTAALTSGLLWSELSDDWPTTGGSWSSMSDGTALLDVYSSGNNYLLAWDGVDEGSRVPKPLVSAYLTTPWVQREGLDMDDVGFEVKGRKMLKEVLPMSRLYSAGASLTFTFGSNDFQTEDTSWGTGQTFDPATDYKLDVRLSGRYLAMKVEFSSQYTSSLSGMDFNAVKIANR